MKYGPLGPGDRRTTPQTPDSKNNRSSGIQPDSYDTDNELDSSSEDDSIPLKKTSPKVAYRPLDLDSDLDHDSEGSTLKTRNESSNPNLNKSSIIRSVPRKFPNPDHYEDPRRAKSRATSPLNQPGETGDFNEVGIPIFEPSEHTLRGSRTSMRVLEDRMLSPQYEEKASQGRLDTVRTLLRSMEEARYRSEQDMALEVQPTPRPPSRGQASSGFGSLPDVRERTSPQLQQPTTTSRDDVSNGTVKHRPFTITDL